MAKVTIVHGTMPTGTSGTADFTESGFGTVGAAIVIMGDADTTNNPDSDINVSIGFWDGTNRVCCHNRIVDNLTTSDTYRGQYNDRIGAFAAGDYEWDITGITNGVRISVAAGNVAASFYCTVILFSNSLDATAGELDLGNATDYVATATTNHATDVIFFASSGQTTNFGSQSSANMRFGVCVNDGSLTQRVISSWSEDNQARSDCVQGFYTGYADADVSQNALSYGVEVTSITSTQFQTTTRTGAAGNDVVNYLAIGGLADVWMGTLTAPTSTGTDAVTGPGFTPDFIMETLSGLTSTGVGNDINWSIGCATATDDERSYSCEEDDNVDPSDCNSWMTSGSLGVLYSTSASKLCEWSLNSLDANGFTRNWTTVDSPSGTYLGWSLALLSESGAINIVPAEASHAHTADQPTVTQTHQITAAEASHSHTADEPAITQTHAVVAQEAAHAHTADEPTITQTHAVTADEATHAHTSDQPTITQTHVVAADEATHAHTADQPTITQTHVIVASEALHSHTADNVTITAGIGIDPQEATHGHTADQPAITQTHVIVVAEAAHVHAADQPTVTQTHLLTPDEASHSHAADQPTITQTHVIVAAEALHGHTADEPTITQTHLLVVDEANHTHTADQPTITQTHVVVAQEASHAHTADNVTLQIGGVQIEPAEATHAHTADEPAITQTHVVVVAEAIHSHTVDNVTLTVDVAIVPTDATHGHAADSPTITQTHVIVAADALHGHTADQPTVTQTHIIVPADALHTHTADNVELSFTVIVVPTAEPILLDLSNLLLLDREALLVTAALRQTHELIVGDTLLPLRALLTVNGVAVDLTNMTVQFRMVANDGTVKINWSAADINDEVTGDVQYDFEPADVDTPGVYWGWFRYGANGEWATFPPQGQDAKGRSLKIVINSAA